MGWFKEKVIEAEENAIEAKTSFDHKSLCYFKTLYDPKCEDSFNMFNINFMFECMKFLLNEVPRNQKQTVIIDGCQIEYIVDKKGQISIKTIESDGLQDHIDSLLNTQNTFNIRK